MWNGCMIIVSTRSFRINRYSIDMQCSRIIRQGGHESWFENEKWNCFYINERNCSPAVFHWKTIARRCHALALLEISISGLLSLQLSIISAAYPCHTSTDQRRINDYILNFIGLFRYERKWNGSIKMLYISLSYLIDRSKHRRNCREKSGSR